MTRDEFQKEISRLVSAFDKTPFNDVRVEVFWKLVQDLRVSFFRRQIDKMILEYRISDFSEAAIAERRSMNSFRTMTEIGNREDFERGPERLKLIYEQMGIKNIDDAIKGRK